MSWRKYFQEVPQAVNVEKYLSSRSPSMTRGVTDSWLPEVYIGPANRLERYKQYEIMDLDAVIAASVDTIAEFCTQKEEKSKEYFTFEFKDDASQSEIEVLQEKIREWTELNDFDKRLWKILRNVLVYGDQFFVRDPETYRWLWVDPYNVEKVVVNEAQGKEPEEYWIKNPDLNIQSLAITKSRDDSGHGYPSAWASRSTGPTLAPTKLNIPNQQFSIPIDANHMVHLSLSEGLDNNWPFGNSILDPIFKVYKQKSLIEDAILIYRVHRAPERRVFYIDVGNMPANLIMGYLERIKNEINQKRIPSRTGTNHNIMDATSNPMSLTEDFFFPQMADGRGSRVETLPGGQSLGQIDDLDHFNNELKTGLKVPKSYITNSHEQDSQTMNDGKTSALIAEHRFSAYCQRLQSLVNDMFDREFKLYLKAEGITIEASLFQLTLNTPQNFAKYRQIEIDNAMISTWGQIAEARYISKRFALKRWLGLTEDEIVENEEMWQEENPTKSRKDGDVQTSDDLRTLGVRPDSGDMGGLDDLAGLDMEEPTGEDSAISGDENTVPGGDEGGSIPGAPPPPSSV